MFLQTMLWCHDDVVQIKCVFLTSHQEEEGMVVT